MPNKVTGGNMRSITVRKIAAVAAGAALLGIGFAVAGPITWNNVPIINSAGQPVVQVVIGSGAKPSDGVAAANIAAAIGNLAYTSVPVTASVNQTQAAKVLRATVSGNAGYSLSSQQVWLNESSTAATGSGTYAFSALIGSVLNRGINLNTPPVTKYLDGSGTYSYKAPSANVLLTDSPMDSPYTFAGYVPTGTSVTPSYNGGGITFTTFSSGTNPRYDNIYQVSNSQLPSLKANAGSAGESEYLWVTGFPVYDQQSSVNNFALLDANGAYQAVFNKPMNLLGTGGKVANNGLVTNPQSPTFTLLGQNWTVISAVIPITKATTTTAVQGGSLQLAQSQTPLTTLYIGQNLTSGQFMVTLADLGQPNSAGVSPASLYVYYKGTLTNQTSVYPGNLIQYNVSGHILDVKVNQTFAGLYAYSKWARLQLYSNVLNITNGKTFNQTTNPNWFVNLEWTNTTSSAAANAQALQSIVIYGTASQSATLTPGQSFSFITNPATYKLQFVGDTLGNSNFDSLTATTMFVGNLQYQNLATLSGVAGLSINNLTEPAQELVVTSSIPNAFSFAGQTSSTVTYDLTPYQLAEVANAATANAASAVTTPVSVALSSINPNYVSTTNPLVVTLSGYPSKSASSASSTSATFTSGISSQVLASTFYNITAIQLSRGLPGVNVTVSAAAGANTPMAVLASYTGSGSSTVTTNSPSAQDYNSPAAGANSIAITLTGNTAAITSGTPLSIAIFGNVITTEASNTIHSASTASTTQTAVFNSVTDNNVATLVGNFFSINGITVTGLQPNSNGLVISVKETFGNTVFGSSPQAGSSNTITGSATATVSTSRISPYILYGPLPGQPYTAATTNTNTIYNQQNGQPTTTFTLTKSSPMPSGTGAAQYFTYNVVEQPVPSNSAALDALSFALFNATGGVSVTPLFQLNYSGAFGTKHNVTYFSTQGSAIDVHEGFRTEKGSKVASITPTVLTLDLAKAVDMLQFAVAPQASNVSKSGWKLYGPYGVGQATNLPNVSIGNVAANISVSSGSYVVTGVNAIVATPSVSSATTYVALSNLPTTPLVVLDSSANPSSNLILVGSGYVNSLSQQLQNTYNVSVTPSAGALVNAYGSNRILVAGYYANQTTAASNSFIQQLYANAAKG